MIDADAATLRRLAQYKQRTTTGAAFTLGYTYGLDGEAVPTGDVTVTVTDTAGDTVYSGAATQVDDTDQYTVPLLPASFPAVDILAVVWTADVDGVDRTDVTLLDVCASRLFTLSALRAILDVEDDDLYPDVLLESERIVAEDFIEASCGRAYAIRLYVGKLNRVEWYVMPGLPAVHDDVQALRALTIDGVPVEDDDLEGFIVGARGFIYAADDYLEVNVELAYEHGERTPDAGRAALILARHRVIHGPLDDRATALPVEGGGTIQLLTPGVRGSVTGIPEVDAFILAHCGNRWA